MSKYIPGYDVVEDDYSEESSADWGNKIAKQRLGCRLPHEDEKMWEKLSQLDANEKLLMRKKIKEEDD